MKFLGVIKSEARRKFNARLSEIFREWFYPSFQIDPRSSTKKKKKKNNNNNNNNNKMSVD